MPHPTTPSQAQPSPATVHALACLTRPILTTSNHALPSRGARLTKPNHTLPHLSMPNLALPRRATVHATFVFLKTCYSVVNVRPLAPTSLRSGPPSGVRLVPGAPGSPAARPDRYQSPFPRPLQTPRWQRPALPPPLRCPRSPCPRLRRGLRRVWENHGVEIPIGKP